MTQAPDVLVLGGGAAGLCAAVAAKKAGAAQVVVLKKAEGATALSSGAVDVADGDRGLLPGAATTPFDSGMDITASLLRLASERPRHPYARVPALARGRMAEALSLLEEAAEGLRFAARDDDKNLVVATQLGTLKRAARVQASAGFDLSRLASDARVLVVQLEDLAGFDAPPVADVLAWIDGLSAQGGARHGKRRFDVVRVPAGSGRRLEASPRAYAASLDDAGERALIERVAAALKAAANGGLVACALLPPVFGLDERAQRIKEQLSERCGFPVVELLALPQSAPGQRLARALERGAEAAGVVVKKADALSSLISDERVREVRAREKGGDVLYAPKAVVLATGRFLAGGLVRDGSAIEPVFGLPLVTGGEPVSDRFIGSLTADRPEGEHAIFRAGIAYDETLRPLTADGARLAHNLFAAGSVLEGYDPARDGSGLGVAALTGMLSGEAAAGVTRS